MPESVLRRFEPVFRCWECDAESPIGWPAEETVYAIERILMMRPHPKNRNWVPGESLHDLMFENGQHGHFDLPELTPEDAGTILFSVDDVRITVDRLPAALGSQQRFAIEAA